MCYKTVNYSEKLVRMLFTVVYSLRSRIVSYVETRLGKMSVKMEGKRLLHAVKKCTNCRYTFRYTRYVY